MIDSVDQLPASLRPREFKVGDRVVVRLSAECLGAHGGLTLGSAVSHLPKMDGETGTIDRIDNAEREVPSLDRDEWVEVGPHRITVCMDQTYQSRHSDAKYPLYCVYAAAELEPIGDES